MLKPLSMLPVLAVAVLTFALPVAAEENASPDTVVARVGDEDITLGHMMTLYAGLPAQYRQVPAARLFDAILDQLIQQTALSQALTAEEPRSVKLSLENERRALRAAVEMEGALEGAVSDEAVQATYDAKYASGTGGTEWNASHILVETEEEAAAIRDEVLGGADFAEVAKEKSTGPSGPGGGSLGWFGEGMMVPPFEAAVKGLSKGDVSEPVQTQFGWHVVKLNDARDVAAPALEEVRGEIVEELRQSALQAHIDQVTAAASVERSVPEGLDPEILGQTELLDQ